MEGLLDAEGLEADLCDVVLFEEGRRDGKVPVENQGVEVVPMEEDQTSCDWQIDHDLHEEDQ